jgi:Na+-translocating ferredoxin:NAD+ oxidoreductase RnfD subunit
MASSHMRSLLSDPRHYQIAALAGLLLFGVTRLGFDVRLDVALVGVVVALAVQALGTRLAGLARFDARSPLISSLSLALLLRTESLALAALAAAIAIGSKFLLRLGGKHLFNPTNLALVALLVATDRAWVSPGQWGHVAFFGFLIAALGGLVVHRATRADVSLAFLTSYGALLLGRALYLGDPLAIPLHQMKSGALLLFAFFMISDPKTTPDSRAGRIAFAAAVAALGWWIQFRLWEPNGLLYALAMLSPVVAVIDRLAPGARYRWPGELGNSGGPSVRPMDLQSWAGRRPAPTKGFPMIRRALTLAALALFASTGAQAFCGFYVARADAKLYNQASQVALVRDGDRTVLTMANDYQGDPKEFALVIPVPTVLKKEQIHVADGALVEHLDAYTAPRLVEYFDENPCQRQRYDALKSGVVGGAPAPMAAQETAADFGVKIEAQYTVGEYDILILSAEQSDGLVAWLKGNGYRIPDGAEAVVGSYLRQGMKFFVAKVNLGEKAKLGINALRPLQIAFESPKFMLPIRLGTVNAKGPQELLIYTLTRAGRVETTNYRTVKLPSDAEIPPFVKDDFGRFYVDMFGELVEREGMRTVFLEYAWDMGWCDPCAADPLTAEELRELGVFWVDREPGNFRRPVPPGGGAQDVFVTRLHVRYDREHFPADLQFQSTGNRENFQGRFILRHPWQGSTNECREARQYLQVDLPQRQEKEIQTLAHLTGWDVNELRLKAKLGAPKVEKEEKSWWEKLWGDGR